jgi:hypothetical protein
MQKWAADYVRLWNEGDKQAWLENWRRIAPGDYTMWDPVGTPPKHGFEQCVADSWDLFQKTVRFHTPPETLFFNGNEVAWVMHNRFEKNGRQVVGHSIETFCFGDDGSVAIRTWYVVPSHDDPALGETFQEYLPGD